MPFWLKAEPPFHPSPSMTCLATRGAAAMRSAVRAKRNRHRRRRILHKLNIPEFHNEPPLVGAEEPADFRLTDWLPESGARQHLNGCHCHLKISARATLSLKYAVNGLLSGGAVLRGWVRSVSGSTAQGLPSIEGGLAEKQTIGAICSLRLTLN